MDEQDELLDSLCKRLRALMGEAQHHADSGDGLTRVQDCLRKMHVAISDTRLALMGPIKGDVLQARQREVRTRAHRKVVNG